MEDRPGVQHQGSQFQQAFLMEGKGIEGEFQCFTEEEDMEGDGRRWKEMKYQWKGGI